MHASTFESTAIRSNYNRKWSSHMHAKELVHQLYISLLWQAFTTRSVTKAMSIQFIDGKCHIKKRKSRKTALSGYYVCLSHDLLLMSSGAGTHIHTHTPTFMDKTISRNQVAHAPGLKKLFHSKIMPQKILQNNATHLLYSTWPQTPLNVLKIPYLPEFFPFKVFLMLATNNMGNTP